MKLSGRFIGNGEPPPNKFYPAYAPESGLIILRCNCLDLAAANDFSCFAQRASQCGEVLRVIILFCIETYSGEALALEKFSRSAGNIAVAAVAEHA